MNGTGRLHAGVWVVIAGVSVGSTSTTLASDLGQIAAAMVTEAGYRHILDDMLYTHDGDDRCWGPEHHLARANIATLMANYGLDVTLETFDYDGDDGYYNVVGTKLGTLDETVEYVIGAHFDSFSFDDPEFGAPGADDNASGTALVLEAARILSAYESDYTIRFVAFDREEQGLHGAWGYATDHIGDDIQWMISIDMVAYDNGAHSVDLHCRDLSDLAPDLEQAVDSYGNGLGHSSPGWVSYSDHSPFDAVGFDACLMIEDLPNPNIHSAYDSVDTPEYIDYAFAVKSVRSIIGLLVDEAGVHVDVPDADFDGDGDVDGDDYAQFVLCFAGADIPVNPPCDFFDLDGDGDVDCTDCMLFTAVWTGPGDPPLCWICNLLAPESVEAQGGRSLIVTPPEHGMPMALLVEGDPEDPNVSCMSLAEGQRYYLQPGGGIVRTDEPEYQMYDAWGTVVVTGYEIVPETSYRVWCDYGPAGLSSTGVPATTERWGDVVGDFVGGEWTSPDDNVDFMDIYSIVEAFRHLPTAPPVSWVDLVGQSGNECTPDAAIDFLDISAAVEAFKGNSYWESMSWCPAPCE